ncbi:MAG: hypothetical protein ABJZ64_15640 [Paracoccaceae bacterium]
MKLILTSPSFAVEWQAKLVSWNALIGAAYLLFSTIVIVFWLPVQLYNTIRLPLHISIAALYIVQCLNLIAIIKKVDFDR